MKNQYNLKDNHILFVEIDESPVNPREDSNIGKMVCFHKRYNLGDDTDLKTNYFESWDELKYHILKTEDVACIKPLYLYEHSGITISTTPFSCRWDSGQIGFIYCTKEDVEQNEISEENCHDLLESEVLFYDKYLQGDVYSYTLYKVETCSLGHEHLELIDSMGGFYGDNIAINGMLENIPNNLIPENLCTVV
jgi:hypothetical protein